MSLKALELPVVTPSDAFDLREGEDVVRLRGKDEDVVVGRLARTDGLESMNSHRGEPNVLVRCL